MFVTEVLLSLNSQNIQNIPNNNCDNASLNCHFSYSIHICANNSRRGTVSCLMYLLGQCHRHKTFLKIFTKFWKRSGGHSDPHQPRNLHSNLSSLLVAETRVQWVVCT